METTNIKNKILSILGRQKNRRKGLPLVINRDAIIKDDDIDISSFIDKKMTESITKLEFMYIPSKSNPANLYFQDISKGIEYRPSSIDVIDYQPQNKGVIVHTITNPKNSIKGNKHLLFFMLHNDLPIIFNSICLNMPLSPDYPEVADIEILMGKKYIAGIFVVQDLNLGLNKSESDGLDKYSNLDSGSIGVATDGISYKIASTKNGTPCYKKGSYVDLVKILINNIKSLAY